MSDKKTDAQSSETPAGAVQTESGMVVPKGTPATGETVAGGPPPAPGFTGASTASFMAGQSPEHPMARNQGVASAEPPAGGRDESIPVTRGNQHMLIGVDHKAVEGAFAEPAAGSGAAVVGGPGTDNPQAGITRTAGEPEGAVAPIRQVGNTVILEEQTADSTKPEFEPGRPKPRTDVDADPHEVTTPGFQGLDKVNPLPPTVPPDKAIQHRGWPNEPHVTGVQSVGDPPVRVIGSESSEAKAIEGGASPEEAQRASQHPSRPDEADTESEEDSGAQKKGRLPEDFPGYAALDEAGEATYAKVRKRIEKGTLTEIPGIGEATAQKIEEAVKE